MNRVLTLTEQRAIQHDAINRIKRRKHASYVAWTFEDKRRGFRGRQASIQIVKPATWLTELASGVALLVIAFAAITCLGALQGV